MSETAEMTLRDYGRVVWRRKWIVVAAMVATVAGALLMSTLQEPIYEADAQILVEPRSGDAVFEPDNPVAVANLDRAIQTEIRVMEGQQVRERVRQDLGLDELPPKVDASPVGSTDVVEVTVRSGDPRVAQQLADAYVDAYVETRRDQAVSSLAAAGEQLQSTVDKLQTQIDSMDAGAPQRESLITQQATFKQRLDQLQIDSALTTGGASVVQPADLPTEPVVPTPVRTAMLAAALGLLLGLGAAFLVDYLDDSLRSTEDIEATTGLPVLAVVPVEPPPDNRPIALSEPTQFAVEVYRGLRTTVQFLGLDTRMRVIQITSSLPGEGKTTIATNLAVVFAQAGSSVILIDADLRRPRTHEVFDVPQRPGLTERLIAAEGTDVAVNELGSLSVLPAGTMAPNPSEILSSVRFSALVKELATRYDYVIIDSAPVLPVADSLALSRVVDGVLVAVQANRTSRRTLSEGLARLHQVGAPVTGLVLNRAADRSSEGYGYGYAYRTDTATLTPGDQPALPPPPAPETVADDAVARVSLADEASAAIPGSDIRPIGDPR